MNAATELSEAVAWLKSDQCNVGARTETAVGTILTALATMQKVVEAQASEASRVATMAAERTTEAANPVAGVADVMRLADAFAAAHLRLALADLQGRPTIINVKTERDRLESAVRALATPSQQEDGQPVAMTDERIDHIADLTVKGMPDGIQGFMKEWGWRQFARNLAEILSTRAALPARSSVPLTDAEVDELWEVAGKTGIGHMAMHLRAREFYRLATAHGIVSPQSPQEREG